MNFQKAMERNLTPDANGKLFNESGHEYRNEHGECQYLEGDPRDIAIDWQNWQSEESLSYSELSEWQNYFETLANKFNLTDEFKENGIL